jgi:hypothetical protein
MLRRCRDRRLLDAAGDNVSDFMFAVHPCADPLLGGRGMSSLP